MLSRRLVGLASAVIVSHVAHGNNPRRALIVAGDGGDNASTTTFEQDLR